MYSFEVAPVLVSKRALPPLAAVAVARSLVHLLLNGRHGRVQSTAVAGVPRVECRSVIRCDVRSLIGEG